MKRKFILFVTVLVATLCVFALTVSASNIYSDYTEKGINGEAPIFSFLGYSVGERSGLCAGYTVDQKALKNYKSATGKDLSYGLVVSLKDFISDNKPLEDDGSVPKELKEKVFVFDFSESGYSRISVSFNNIPSTKLDSNVIMSLYVLDTDGVKYIGEQTTSDGPESISYNDVLLGRPATPATPPVVEVTINGMTYSTNGTTEPAADRIKQQNSSNADYKSGSSLSSFKLYTALLIAKGIAVGGDSLADMPIAADFMNHYLKNTGTDYTIDVAQFISEDSGAMSARNKALNNALRACEQLARKGQSLTVNQLSEGHPMQWELETQNWQYAVGSYFDDVDVINLTVTEVDGVKTYSADIKYIVTDFYNWDTNDYKKFKDLISPHDLHELHKAGKAREFMSYGEITYSSITWTEGQTVDQIAGLN